MHQLARRKIPKKNKPAHFGNRLLDPQLYLANLSAAESPKACQYLASYPWFGIEGLPTYDSAQISQREWKDLTLAQIVAEWPGVAPSDDAMVKKAVESCLDFQVQQQDCKAIIAPSPLTSDPNTSYDVELDWLDRSIAYAEAQKIDLPIYATVAITDSCLRYTAPSSNRLLDLILDTVSSRAVKGVYLVIEQGAEPSERRQCASSKTLESILYFVHTFSKECNLEVIVNFLGHFGLVCQAAGAAGWASNWYKSLYRLRLADKLQGGRSFPSLWSSSINADIHLRDDLDQINRHNLLEEAMEITPFTVSLSAALKARDPVSKVPDWAYRSSNVTSAINHYLSSAIAQTILLESVSESGQLDFVEEKLEHASRLARRVQGILTTGATHLEHVPVWLEALKNHRRSHKV
jgi:hypothetical protein